MSAAAGRWARRALLAVLVLALALLAGRPLWAEAAVMIGLALLLPLLALRLVEEGPPPGGAWIVAGLLFAGVAILQLVPLPHSLVERLSPAAAEAYSTSWPGEAGADFVAVRAHLEAARGTGPVVAEGEELPMVSVDQVLREAGLRGEESLPRGAGTPLEAPAPLPADRLRTGPRMPLNLSPWRGVGALCKLLLLLATFALASSVLRAPSRAYPFMAALAVLGGIVALVAVAHIFRGAPNPLVLVTGASEGASVTYGPFPNKNHLAGFLALLLPACLALSLSRAQPPARRVLWLGVAFLLVLGNLAASSRGGLIALAVGVCALGTGLVLREGRRRQGAALLAAASLGVVTLLAWAPEQTQQGFQELVETRPHEEMRWSIWTDSTEMLQDFPWTGVGLDAFSSVYPAYKSFPAHLRFTHLENDYLQYLVETGLLGLPALLLALAAGCLGFLRAARSSTAPVLALGAWGGVAGLAAHGFVDFNFHVTANALAFVLMLALAVATTPRGGRSSASRSRPSTVRRASYLAAAVLATVGAVSFYLPRGGGDLLLKHSRTLDEEGAFSAAMEAARRASARSPMDPRIREHQSELYRLAAALDPRPEGGWARASLENAALGLLMDPTRTPLHRAIGRLFYARGDWQVAEAWFARAVRFHPTDLYAREFHADALRRLGRDREALEEYARASRLLPPATASRTLGRLFQKALLAGDTVEELEPLINVDEIRASSLARTLAARGEIELALEVASRALTRWPESPDTARSVFELAWWHRDMDLADRAAGAWTRLEPEAARPVRARAQIHAARGDGEIAVELARRAVSLDPQDLASRHVLVQVLRDHVGLGAALEAAREGLHRHPSDRTLQRLKEELQRERMRRHRSEVDAILGGRE